MFCLPPVSGQNRSDLSRYGKRAYRYLCRHHRPLHLDVVATRHQDRREPCRLRGTPLCPVPLHLSDQPQILAAVFVGVPSADDVPTVDDCDDDVGPLIDFNLFPIHEGEQHSDEDVTVEVTFRQFRQVRCLFSSPQYSHLQ